MFFDDHREDARYPQLLRDIAMTQRALLACRFDWAGRAAIPQKKGGWFGRKRPDPQYERLLAQLMELKGQAQRHRAQMGYGGGVFWWNLPWAQVEAYLVYDLSQEEEAGDWQFVRRWEKRPGGDGTALLLREEGHFSSFSSYSTYETGVVSSYSQQEIQDKMRDYDRMMNRYDLTALAIGGNGPVKSWLTGAEYDSAAQYLLSGEHFYVRDHYRTQYARSIYTEKETTTLNVHSNSRHYEAVYAVAGFAVSGGVVQSLNIYNYELCAARGDVPEDIQTLYRSRDAAVGCAAYLADDPSVKSVPLALFGSDLKDGAVGYQDAMRQGEICTCLAEKLE